MRRIPFIKQKSGNLCGPTCVQMLAAFYGKKYNIETLLAYCELTKTGVSVRDIVNMGKHIGFFASSFTVTLQEARRMPLQAIIYLKEGHFVILEKIKQIKGNYYYTVVDPDFGRVLLPEDELVARWMEQGKGFGVMLAPEDNFLEVNPETSLNQNRKEIIADIKSILKTHQRKFTIVLMLSFVVLITNWAMPIILQKTIDDGILQKDINMVWTMLLAQFAFFIGYIASNIVSSIITTKVSFTINIDFVKKYFNKIVRLPIQYFDTTFRSDLIQRFSDLWRINGFVTDDIINIFFSLLNLIVFSTLLVVYNHIIFFLFFLFSLISTLYSVAFLRRRKNIDYSLFAVDSQRRNAVYELVMGMPDIKTNNAYHTRIKAWNVIEAKVNQLKLSKLFVELYASNGLTILSRLRDIILTALSAYYVIQGEMTLGTMMMISYVLGQLSAPISAIMGFIASAQEVELSYDRVLDVHKKQDEDDGKSIQLTTPIVQDIELVNVRFKYPGSSNKYILNNVNMTIPLGKTTAVVGPSGGGKSTLLKLILGFYPSSEGKILINGNDISDISLESWREHCGVVMQNGHIFSASIAENIALNHDTIDWEWMELACKIANLYDFISQLPMQFHTKIGEIGLDLSGGEKQRLFIARAVYRNPEILLFDEATSSLDAQNETEIMSNLTQFSKNKTVVIVAHRLSTIQHADNILFIDKGEIIEQGTHAHLMNRKGAYYQLVKNQISTH